MEVREDLFQILPNAIWFYFFFISSVHPFFLFAFTHLLLWESLAIIVLKQEIFVLVSCIILPQGLSKIQISHNTH